MVNRRDFLKVLGAGATAALVPDCLERTAFAAPTMIRYPYLQDVRGDRATVLWATLEDGAGAVAYSVGEGEFQTAVAGKRFYPTSETRLFQPYYQHRAELTGLVPGNDCIYQPLVNGVRLPADGPILFRTPDEGPFRFLAFGDSGMATAPQLQVAQLMRQEPASLVVHTGDIAYFSGTYEEFQDRHFLYYWEIMRRVPFYPSLGNHEYVTDNAAPYLALHALPTEDVPAEDRGRYYSFDWGNAHFVALDSNAPLRAAAAGRGKMLSWLDEDLRRSRKYWRIVYFHHPPYASGPNVQDPTSALVREQVVPILEQYQVELVLNGHEHSYQRSRPIQQRQVVETGKGTVYVTTGGGGADLYPVPPSPLLAFGESAFHYVRGDVNGSRLTLESIRSDAKKIDGLILEPLPIATGAYLLTSEMAGVALPPGIDGLISISGRRLAAEDATASLPQQVLRLSGVSVEIRGQKLPLVSVSSTQILAGLPAGLIEETSLHIATPNGSAVTALRLNKRRRR